MTRRPAVAATLAALLSAGFAAPAGAGWLPDRERIDALLDKLGGGQQIDESKSVDWGVLPGPFYMPETSLGIGVALVGLYRADQEKTTPLSSLTLMGYASVTGVVGIKFDDYSYFDGDRWRLFVDGSLSNEPSRFWGVGYAAGRDDHWQEYTAQGFGLWPKGFARIAPATWAGLGWSVVQMHASQLEDGQANAILATPAGRSDFASGLSAHLLHDTRDFAPNPARGQVLSLDYAAYAPAFGGEERFDALTARYALYQALDARSILAFELYGDFRSGDVPWNLLPALGNDARMRGYYNGRYRDRDVVSTQLEWRHQFAWRHGMTLWAGAGTLAPRPGDLGEHWLPSFGAGYRFMFKPRVNVRLDLGFGRDSAGVYFQVGEAF
ncbi:BamA/TamA family outer membrane protein [Solimonas soli]|uniref:BamA/TamA family outer membrane protein n=1 Tax=Solimonas soli TaxID=413479 RepID=UPI0004801A8F|nr:BamA/TamA family outer membrane protein [Solimonas soli]